MPPPVAARPAAESPPPLPPPLEELVARVRRRLAARTALAWLPGAEGLVPSSALPASPDVFVSLDAASPGRLGELAGLLEGAATSVVVDHHASNPGFGAVRLVLRDGAGGAARDEQGGGEDGNAGRAPQQGAGQGRGG